jgi:hypothetical protein
VSRFERPGDVFLADCPARLAIEVVADKWTVVVIYGLGRGPRRHNELKMLSRWAEAHGADIVDAQDRAQARAEDAGFSASALTRR